MCVCCAASHAFFMEGHKSEMEYNLGFDINKKKDYTFAYNFFVRYGNWMLLFTYSTLWPIHHLIP